MDVIVERCAGLDVHRDSVVATVRVPGKGKSRRRRAQRTRTFATTIAQLEQLADWLEGFGVTLVGMEATGVYWKPVFWVLERRFEEPARFSVYRWVVRCCRGRGLRSGCVGLPLRSSSCNRFASSSWRAVSRARSAAARRRRWGSVLWS